MSIAVNLWFSQRNCPSDGFNITEIQEIDINQSAATTIYNFQPVTITKNSKIKIEGNVYFFLPHTPAAEANGIVQLSLIEASEPFIIYQVEQGFRAKNIDETYEQYETLELLWMSDVEPGTYNFSIRAGAEDPPFFIESRTLILTVFTER
ncbi:hypothetical protein [Terribacillus aidingensis]|uniref:hypothetical protein n=1 Tax=Terribacillus aidingensis TaxID=586416 RepID=UPI00344C245E